MRYLIWLALVVGCSSSQLVHRWEPSNWMDESDYVNYVNFMSRSPANRASPGVYKFTGDCGGYPRVDVKTAPGFCLSQVYGGKDLRKPRTALQVSGDLVVLVDQVSWTPHQGKIFILNIRDGSLREILSDKSFSDKKDPKREIINRPHLVARGPDGKIYLGAATSILRFNPLASNVKGSIEVVIGGIPAVGLHPLKSFAFDNAGSILVNVGSATNNCQKQGLQGEKQKSCSEAEHPTIGQGQIRRYRFLANGKIDPKFEIYAKGLRNSVAMAWDSERKVLLQGENSRDAINKFNSKIPSQDFPHDELNVVRPKQHYGWPYCYDNNLTSPEWTYINCKSYQKPQLLLPPHSAPLSFHIYRGNLFPKWYSGRLLATFHGYEPKGHRLVAFKRDGNGLPIGVPQSIIYGWDTKGEQRLGSPVGITELEDGSVLIVEDENQKVMRLFYDAREGEGVAVQEVDLVSTDDSPEDPDAEEKRRLRLLDKLREGNAPAFTQFQNKVIDKTCYTCHGGINSRGVQLKRYDDEGNAKRIVEKGMMVEILEMMRGNPNYPTMPPQGFDSEAERREAVRLMELWIATLQN